MPTKGWAGLTSSDNSQAKAIAAVMKKFTDEGIEVWLRFGASLIRTSSAVRPLHTRDLRERADPARSFFTAAHEVK